MCVPGTGVEPARPYGHIPLKDARLPIPPPGQCCYCTKESKNNNKFIRLKILKKDLNYFLVSGNKISIIPLATFLDFP